MYTKKQFKTLIGRMIEVYGVCSYINNIQDDMTQEEIDDDLWFAVPCCGEVIYFEDVDENWAEMLKNGICPICGNPFDEE